jgi:hypothetical protein
VPTDDQSAEHLQEKAKGNQAFAAGDMKGAVAAYTRAIQVRATMHACVAGGTIHHMLASQNVNSSGKTRAWWELQCALLTKHV